LHERSPGKETQIKKFYPLPFELQEVPAQKASMPEPDPRSSTWLMFNHYRFISDRALEACSKYGVESMSVAATRTN
jgi:hypothetical protein